MGWRARAVTSWRVWLAVVVAITLPATWWVVTGRAVDGIEIRMLATPACTGTEVAQRPIGFDDEVMPQITLRPGMSCRLSLEIRNTSRLPVQLKTVQFPLMGTNGAAAVQIKEAWIDHSAALIETASATANVDRRLNSDESIEVELIYVFRADGCNSPGSKMWLRAAQVKASLFLRTELTEGPDIAFVGTEASSCDT